MTGNGRQLQVSTERCIGCRACATTCPADLITLADGDYRRTVRFVAVCAEECDRCVAACPTQAISLVSGVAPEGKGMVLGFPLVACEDCGRPLAPVEMLAHLSGVIPEQLQADAEGQAWLALCPACRRQGEVRQMAREVVLTRC